MQDPVTKKVGITITSENQEKLIELATQIQQTVSNQGIDQDDMIKLLKKANSKPGLISSALKFI